MCVILEQLQFLENLERCFKIFYFKFKRLYNTIIRRKNLSSTGAKQIIARSELSILNLTSTIKKSYNSKT